MRVEVVQGVGEGEREGGEGVVGGGSGWGGGRGWWEGWRERVRDSRIGRGSGKVATGNIYTPAIKVSQGLTQILPTEQQKPSLTQADTLDSGLQLGLWSALPFYHSCLDGSNLKQLYEYIQKQYVCNVLIN